MANTVYSSHLVSTKLDQAHVAKQWACEFLAERMLGRTPQAVELSGEEHEAKALAFFQPLTQKAFAEHMMKTLPAGDEGPVREPQG